MSERPERIPSADLELEGRLHLPDGAGPFAGVVVCHPHPQYGGDMRNNVVMTVCAALTAGGFAALRFNFRGVGRSGGAFDGGRGEGLDAAAAVSHLAALPTIDATRMGLAGYSFGALAALAAADARLRALALIAPPHCQRLSRRPSHHLS
ncbi:MAG TPA: CocE/NonD family hydrolase [Vicinamibacterales bacterium]|nr:CocE/NonD family hydrolase [Vicinamibacterales bacterium]